MNAFWTGNRVCLVSRTKANTVSRRFVQAQYTCFLRCSDVDLETERQLRESRHVKSMRREGSWWRICWYNWKLLRLACKKGGLFERLGLRVFEADVHPVRRFLTDNSVEIQKPKRCYIDLEVDARKPIQNQIDGKARVLSWALCDDDGNKVYGCLEEDTNDAEVLLLTDLWDELLEYDQVCAWGGDRYDFPLLKNRSERLGVQVEPRRWLFLDHLEVYRRFNMSASESGDEKESMALDRVAQAVLGRGKHKLDARRSWDHWCSNRDELILYNIEDAVLMRDIEERTGYLDLHFIVCEVCSTLPDSHGTNPTNFVEGYMLKLGLKYDQHYPTVFDFVPGAKYEGAYVMAPKKIGLLKNVHVCDFASLYPSIIITWNMSPETLVSEVIRKSKRLRSKSNVSVAPYTEQWFRTDSDGLLPKALARMLQLRAEWKKRKNVEPPGTIAWKYADRRSSAYKIVANSFYGVQGSIFSRFHVREVAESITQAGKWLILETERAALSQGFECVYGDTDSLFVIGCNREEFAKFVQWCNDELYPQLLRRVGCKTNAIKLGYEKEFLRMVLMAKKRYAARYAHYEGTEATVDSKPEIKGLEYKRGDTLKMARDMQYQLVQMILYDEVEDIESIKEWLRDWRKRVLDEQLTLDDVRMSSSLGKDVRKYRRKVKKDGTLSALPVHVEVALELGKRGRDVGEGVRIEYVVVDGTTPIKAVPAEDFEGRVDRFYLWENLVYKPTQRVLDAAFPEHKWGDYHRVRPFRSGKPRIDLLMVD